jgi:hypothetical protein
LPGPRRPHTAGQELAACSITSTVKYAWAALEVSCAGEIVPGHLLTFPRIVLRAGDGET